MGKKAESKGGEGEVYSKFTLEIAEVATKDYYPNTFVSTTYSRPSFLTTVKHLLMALLYDARGTSVS